ncbi:MAG: efflux RND transporter permease subunit [Draconibacterium sp.]|nr:efflux RND transporter permease subunit [Draconibacterium sp.]
MKNIFVRFRSPISVILLLILVGGVFSYKNMKTSLFPDITFPKIKIIADNGNQPVDKMMVTVTKPLENAIKRVQDLQLIRSTTSLGSCEISAFMEWGSNIDLDKQRVESQISQIKNNLPPNVQITIEKMNPSILPVMGYSLQSTVKNQVELKMIAEYVVKPYISRIEGIAAVEVIGGREKEYRITLDQEKMSLLRLSAQDIENALKQTDFIQSNGYTIDYNRLYLTVTDATIKNKEQLENLVLLNDATRKIKISDIATVEITARTEYVKIKADGKDIPLVAVLKQPNSNLIDVAKQVSEKVAELNKLLPKGVVLKPYYNQSEFVSDSIKSIIDVLWIGLLLAIVVSTIFLRSMKASAVILVTIPLTLALTFIILGFIGYDFNIMTIGAIAAAIGLIIDDAIIVVEQIHRTHEEYPDRKPKELVGKAIQFLFPSMISSSLSTIVILIPFELMTGVAGAYFKVLTQTMIITLACSFIITWLGLPVIYLLLSKDRELSKKHKVVDIKKRHWIEFFIRRPYLSILIVLALIVSIVVVVPKLETGFLPEMDEGSIVLDYKSPPGTSLEETDRLLVQLDQILELIPEVKTYSRRTGTQMGFFITEPNSGDYLIELYKKRNRTTAEVSDDIRKRIERGIPALQTDFMQVVTDMLGDLMDSGHPIEVKIFGTDHEKLKELSVQIGDSLQTIDGVADVFNGIVVAGPMLKILPKEDKLKQFGLTSSDLHAQIQTYLEGTVVGTIPEKEQLTNIRMIFPLNNQTPLNKLKQVKICTAAGDYFPLSNFANFSVQSGVSEIKRENLQTMGMITARMNNRDLGSVMKDIQQKLQSIRLPPTYQIVYGGSYAQQQKSFEELLKILILGALLVFTVVLFMYKSLKLSLTVLFISLLGISGSVLALYFTKTPLNVGSYTGLIMIIGIIGENSIFTIQQFLFELKTTSVSNALGFAISARLRPKLMTATGAIAALSPLAAGIGTGAKMHQPLAIAVIGGLIVALPLLLIVLPGFLKLLYPEKNEAQKIVKK